MNGARDAMHFEPQEFFIFFLFSYLTNYYYYLCHYVTITTHHFHLDRQHQHQEARVAHHNRRLQYTAKPLRVEYPYREAIGISRIRP